MKIQLDVDKLQLNVNRIFINNARVGVTKSPFASSSISKSLNCVKRYKLRECPDAKPPFRACCLAHKIDLLYIYKTFWCIASFSSLVPDTYAWL